MKNRISGAGLAVAVALTASGCAQRIDGHATAQEPLKPVLAAVTEPVDFDPCADISDSTLRRSDLNPSTELDSSDRDRYACGWLAYDESYEIAMFAYDNRTMEQFDTADPAFVFEGRTTVGGRPALVVSPSEIKSKAKCMVIFDAEIGAVALYLFAVDAPRAESFCDVALSHADDLVADVPAA